MQKPLRGDLFNLNERSADCLFAVMCRVRTVMGNLEKSWNFKMVISRSGKVTEKT